MSRVTGVMPVDALSYMKYDDNIWDRCLGQVSWIAVLNRCLGQVSWIGVLDWCLGQVSWTGVLDWCPSRISPHGEIPDGQLCGVQWYDNNKCDPSPLY